MPEPFLPLFPSDVTTINRHLSFARREGRIYYFNGPMPVFSHEEKDWASFRMFTSQLVCDGNCSQAEIARAFGVSLISLKRYVKKYRQEGVKGFYAIPPRRGGGVLTAAVLAQVQSRLAAGQEVSRIAAELKLKADTINKAVRRGRLTAPLKKKFRGHRKPVPPTKVSAAWPTVRPCWGWVAPGRWNGWPPLLGC